VLFIDEAQELARLIGRNGKEVDCASSMCITADENSIWMLISGSAVSMLTHKVVRKGLANRMEKWNFPTLLESESNELVQKIVEKNQIKVYEGIEKDIYTITNGNPYYIQTIFGPNKQYERIAKKKKSFGTKEELKAVFEFETCHTEGKILNFWKEHLEENKENLNKEAPENKGLAFKMLFYIAEKRRTAWLEEKDNYPEVSVPELAKEFKIEERLVEKKLEQLQNADFVDMFGAIAIPTTDIVLSFVLVTAKKSFIDPSITKEEQKKEWDDLTESHFAVAKQEIKDAIKKEMDDKVEEAKKEIDNKVKEIDSKVDKVDNKVDKVDNKVDKVDNKVGKVDNKVEKAKQEAKKGIAEVKEEAKKGIAEVKEEHHALEKKHAKLDKKIRREAGFVRVEKGDKGEEIVEEYIRQKRGVFEKIKINGTTINLKFKVGRKKYELDAMAKVKLPKEKAKTKTGKPRTCVLIVEAKNQEKATSKKEAEIFVEKAKAYQKKEKYNEAKLYFFSREWDKDAKDYLKRHKVQLVRFQVK
jgi:hypothetical protein